MVLLLAAACGVGVSNIYFPQVLAPLIARDLDVSRGAAALVAPVTQLGYVAGIFFLVPLGDRVARGRLIPVLFALVAAGLAVSGTTGSLWILCGASAFVGAVTVVPQILIPMGADLFAGPRAATVVSVLQSGLLAGILLARAFAGSLGQWIGWRAPYLIGAGLAVAFTAVLARVLPAAPASSSHRYPALLRTTVRLFAEQPELRRSCWYQAAVFAGFTAAWTAIALYLTGPDYGYGTSAVALVALVSAASLVAVPASGRAIDREGPERVGRLALVAMLLAGGVLLLGLAGGALGVAGLIAGMLVLDVAVQSGQVANQARIFALVPDARSRLNSAYMTCVFLGGSAGSWIGAHVFLAVGWGGVCAVVAATGALALVRDLAHRRQLSR